MVDYTSLTMEIYEKPVSDRTREHYYSDVAKKFSPEGIDNIRRFQNAHFCVSGTSYIFRPVNFLLSPDVKQNMFYFDGFVLIKGDHAYFTERENLNSYLICFTLDGEGELTYRGKTYSIKKNQGFFIDCREYHDYRTVGDLWHMTALHVDGPLCKDIFSKYAASGNVLFNGRDFPEFEALQFSLLKYLSTIRPYLDYKVSAIIGQLLTELLFTHGSSHTGAAASSGIIEKILRYMQTHFTESITLSSLTVKFGISPAHLEREFKKHTGFTPNAYLINLRINKAKQLLAESDWPVLQVAEIAGFADQSHFIRTFKKLEGITPLQFRKRALNQ